MGNLGVEDVVGMVERGEGSLEEQGNHPHFFSSSLEGTRESGWNVEESR